MLWLNSGIEHFQYVAHARGPRGRNIRIRDATFDSIVTQAWTSLVSIAPLRDLPLRWRPSPTPKPRSNR